MSTTSLSPNKRIAKNTLFLYFRTILVMVVSLYTSRVVLASLGVDDFGIYNVVGGVVAMFGMVSGALTNAITRFVTFELGRGDVESQKNVFSTSVNIQLAISLIISILGEAIGLWFLNCKMNIPVERMHAANWVLHCSLLTFVINLIIVPYNAVIIAHEHMTAFAYFSILEVSLKLAVVYLLSFSSWDKLITYSFLLIMVALCICLVYRIYCNRHFKETKYQFTYDHQLVKKMSKFVGWNFLGTSAYLLNTQGTNILSNIFFGVTVNAARGIAGQAETGVRQFVNNFTVAINPQIIKSFAESKYDLCFSIVRTGAKYSVYLMLFFFIPFVLESEFVLGIWLKQVPEYAVAFWQLAMLGTLVDLPGSPLTTLALATGKIKKFYICMGSFGCMVLPISYILFRLGYPPSSAYWTYIVVYTYLVYVRLILINRQLNFPVPLFLRDVILPTYIVTSLSFMLPLFVKSTMEPGIVRFLLVSFSSFVSIIIFVWIFGVNKSERNKIKAFVRLKFVND